jgi:hypothetical protein
MGEQCSFFVLLNFWVEHNEQKKQKYFSVSRQIAFFARCEP